MIPDILTISRKELREIVMRGGRGKRRIVPAGTVFQVIISALLGITAGLGRNDAGARVTPIFIVAFIAMTSAQGLVTDAIAGERERHTLETLLAAPVADSAILAGKILAIVGYAWTVAVVQLVVIGVMSAVGGHLLSPPLLVVVAILALPEAALAAAFGVQFSMRAPTVRVASRKGAQYGIVVNFVAGAVNAALAASSSGFTRAAIVFVSLVVLVAADISLFGLARVRFRRGRLLLD